VNADVRGSYAGKDPGGYVVQSISSSDHNFTGSDVGAGLPDVLAGCGGLPTPHFYFCLSLQLSKREKLGRKYLRLLLLHRKRISIPLPLKAQFAEKMTDKEIHTIS